MQETPKALYWATGAKAELLELPRTLVRNFGYALSAIQFGRKPYGSVKAVHGFSEAVLELRDSDAAGTYRVIYCTSFGSAVYVLHCFQKKSSTGSKIARSTIALIAQRLKEVRAHHEDNQDKA